MRKIVRKKLRTKARAFTLLELMVSLVLIGLACVVVGGWGVGFLRHHQFQTGSQMFLLELNKWRFSSMLFGSDVVCTLSQDDEGYLVEWRPEAPIEQVSFSQHHLKGIKEIRQGGKKVKTMSVTLFSSGILSSQDVLSFVPLKGSGTLYLDLAYPFSFSSSAPSHPLCQFKEVPSCPPKKERS